jgi:hypothetical protein
MTATKIATWCFLIDTEKRGENRINLNELIVIDDSGKGVPYFESLEAVHRLTIFQRGSVVGFFSSGAISSDEKSDLIDLVKDTLRRKPNAFATHF